MSEFFEQGAGIEQYLDGVNKQQKAFQKRLDIPHGEDLDMALQMMNMAGEYGSILARGDQGSGKSTIASVILGSDYMIDIDENDTSDTLFGYEKPFNNTYALGKIGALILRSNGDIRIGMDELGQAPNVRTLHKLWNGTGFSMQDGNEFVDTTSMALFANTNYPKLSGGVYPIQKQLRSRFGAGLVMESSTIPSPTTRQTEPGLIAPAKVRQELRNFMDQAHPEGKSANPFANQIVDEITQTGLFESIPADARIMGGLMQSVRARRLAVAEEHPKHGYLTARVGRPISQVDIADVTAFNLGKTAELNNEGIAYFSKALGGIRLTEHTKAVIVNRFVAGLAKSTLLASYDKSKLDMTASEIEDSVQNHIVNTSYATSRELSMNVNGITKLEVLDQVILDKIFQKPTVSSSEEGNNNESPKRRFFARR